MCGRYTLAAPDPGTLRSRFTLGESVRVERRYNVAPGDEVLAAIAEDEGLVGVRLRWGLVPHWAGDGKSGSSMINARAETVRSKPAFRAAFARRRCLIIADGFYEWQRQERALRAPKQAYWITRADGAPFAFAGLWASARTSEGETLRTCAIVTTSANRAVEPIHDRMPVILSADDEAAWLAPTSNAEHLVGLLAPLPDDHTAVRPVGSAVNDARYDGPECLEPARPADAPVRAPRLF